MNKKLIYISLIVSAFLIFLAFVVPAQAVNPFDISYPVAELGNCGSQAECQTYCDDPVNEKACFNWAADNGFVSEREVKKARDMEKFNEEEFFGPGGCGTPQECDTFCRVEENLDVCLQHSLDNGYIDQEEFDRIQAESNRTGPGGCTDRESCDNFCRQPDNMPICMQFVVDEGKITQEEADFLTEQSQRHRGPDGPGGHVPDDDFDEEKARELLEEVGGPGGCSTFDECDNFCSNSDNDQVCMDFAIENGLIPPEKVEKIKKMMEIGGPGGCRGPEECDAFCSQPENGEICMNFSIENGLMEPEEIERMKREMEIIKRLDGEGGPGDCRSQGECNNFCSNPENMEECMNFGTEHGMMDEDRMDDMIRQKRGIEDRMMRKDEDFRDFEREFEDRFEEGDYRQDDRFERRDFEDHQGREFFGEEGFEDFESFREPMNEHFNDGEERFDDRFNDEDFRRFNDGPQDGFNSDDIRNFMERPPDFNSQDMPDGMMQDFEGMSDEGFAPQMNDDNFQPPMDVMSPNEEMMLPPLEEQFEEPVSVKPSVLGLVIDAFLDLVK